MLVLKTMGIVEVNDNTSKYAMIGIQYFTDEEKEKALTLFEKAKKYWNYNGDVNCILESFNENEEDDEIYRIYLDGGNEDNEQ